MVPQRVKAPVASAAAIRSAHSSADMKLSTVKTGGSRCSRVRPGASRSRGVNADRLALHRDLHAHAGRSATLV